MSARLALAGCLALLPGCGIVVVDYGSLPPDAAVAAIIPGKSSREDVNNLLGPPEYYRSPAPGEATRSFSPVSTRILKERRVFALGDANYVAERRHDKFLYLILFALEKSKSRADVVSITFDDAGRVETVARTQHHED
jgi:outer membrane protein assembly factor BamE (lipoprotein component of BamABCDE complex)